MAPDRIVLPALRNKSHQELLTCFLGRVALGLSFHERKCRNGQICPFSFEDNVLLTQGSRPRYFLIIAIAATSAAVIWQFAGRISPISLRPQDFG